jgi:DNA-directed RNA polymerase specialized sigma24 family protein
MSSETKEATASQAVELYQEESRLVRETALARAKDVPGKTPKEIAEFLLEQLLKKKKLRESQNINHWDHFAPHYLKRLLQRMSAKRRREIGEFIKANRPRALSMARSIVRNGLAAEEVVSETDFELLTGKFPNEAYYFLALSRNASDLLRRRRNERGKSVPIETASDELTLSPIFSLTENHDPLNFLIEREEREEVNRLVQAAKKDPRWRYIKRRTWAKPLLECAEMTGSND